MTSHIIINKTSNRLSSMESHPISLQMQNYGLSTSSWFQYFHTPNFEFPSTIQTLTPPTLQIKSLPKDNGSKILFKFPNQFYVIISRNLEQSIQKSMSTSLSCTHEELKIHKTERCIFLSRNKPISYFPYICIKIHLMLARHVNSIYT